MKKFYSVFLLMLCVVSFSACQRHNKDVTTDGSEENATNEVKETVYKSVDDLVTVETQYFNYQAPSQSIADGTIPDQVIGGDNPEIDALKFDPCTDYGEKINFGLKLTNKTDKYITSLPVRLSFTDREGNAIDGFSTIVYLTMGPKQEGYYTTKLDNKLSAYTSKKPGERYKSGTSGDSYWNSTTTYSCEVKKDSPRHPASISGVKLGFVTSSDAADDGDKPQAPTTKDSSNSNNENKNDSSQQNEFVKQCVTDNRFNAVTYQDDVDIAIEQKFLEMKDSSWGGSSIKRISASGKLDITNKTDEPLDVYKVAVVIKFGDHVGIVDPYNPKEEGEYNSTLRVPKQSSDQATKRTEGFSFYGDVPSDTQTDISMEVVIPVMTNSPFMSTFNY